MARKKAEVIPVPAPRPTGRPSIFTQELWDRVLCLIEEGQTIRDIAAMADMPAWDTIRRWIRNDETLSSQYRRAREEATDAMEAEILADARTANADNASAIKVRADIIRWAMSRRAPKKYGDKITQEHTGADGGPLEFTEIRRVVVDVPQEGLSMKKALEIPTARVFLPLLKPNRYKGAFGGRGSGKSHFFGGLTVEEHLAIPGHRTVCIREIQKSIARSSKQLIVDKINQFNLNKHFDVQDQVIKTPGDGLIVFQGLQNHTADSIKSLEGFDRAWIEEAQSISSYSWRMLRPTLRKPGSEIWASWNPASSDDPIDEFFRGEGSDRADLTAVRANWSDNPWFNDGTLPTEREEDQRARPDEYDHVWEGDYVTISDAVIFRKRVTVDDFETPEDARFFYGLDWGFSQDPTAIVRCFIRDDVLYVDYEAGGTGIHLDELPEVLDEIPGTRRWPIKADCASPQNISFMATRYRFNMTPAKKWPGSVEDGIDRLKAFKRIVVHRRCPRIAEEFRKYAFKVDPKTEEVLPVIVDAWNHWIDALRYALDGVIQNRRSMPSFAGYKSRTR